MTLESMRKTFAVRMLQRLSSLGVSQSGLSVRMNLPRTTVSAWALGKNLPSDVTSVRLAKELKTSVSYLYGETDDPRPAPDWRNGSGPSSAQDAKLAEVAAKVALIQIDLQALLYPKADTTAEPMELTLMSPEEIARTISHDANGKPVYFEPGAKAARKAKDKK